MLAYPVLYSGCAFEISQHLLFVLFDSLELFFHLLWVLVIGVFVGLLGGGRLLLHELFPPLLNLLSFLLLPLHLLVKHLHDLFVVDAVLKLVLHHL